LKSRIPIRVVCLKVNEIGLGQIVSSDKVAASADLTGESRRLLRCRRAGKKHIAVFGESGSGKTVLNGMLSPDFLRWSSAA